MTGIVEGSVAPTPAATVAVLRDGADGMEVLLLQRNGRGMFGGMWVFPGGQVDLTDMDGADGRSAGLAAEIDAARRAAVREAEEEAALVLDPGRLVVHSWWLPPPGTPRRFATWFFLGAVGPEVDIVVDGGEIVDHRWLTPAAAIAQRDEGTINLAPPTWMTLWWLRDRASAADALDRAAAGPANRFESHVYPDGDRTVVMWEGDAGWSTGDPRAEGARRRLWMDPEGWRPEVASG